jgi:hypothetical protein
MAGACLGHFEFSRYLFVRWMAGSKPGHDEKSRDLAAFQQMISRIAWWIA